MMPIIPVIASGLIALAFVVFLLSKEVRDNRREQLEARAELYRLKTQIRQGAILPDSKGVFRFMIPIQAIGGFADGEIRFAPLDEVPDRMAFAWTDDNGTNHKTTYAITDTVTSGIIEARPVAS